MNTREASSSASVLKCPGCGRDNALPRSGDGAGLRDLACSRCECELGPLVMIRQAAEDRTGQALGALRTGGYEEALRLAEDAWTLIRHPRAACCGLLASILLRDPDRIRAWTRRTGRGKN